MKSVNSSYFLVVMIFMTTLCTGVVGWYSLRVVGVTVVDTSVMLLENIESLYSISQFQVEIVSADKLLTIKTLDARVRQDCLQRIGIAEEKLDTTWIGYEAKLLSETEKQGWERLVAAWKLWRSDHESFLRLAKEYEINPTDGLHEQMLRQVQAMEGGSFNAAAQLLRDRVEDAIEEARDVANNAALAGRRSHTVVATVTLLGGFMAGLLGILLIRDMAVQRRTGKERRASRQWLADIFRLSPQLIYITTVEEGRVLEANEAFCKVTGYTREEVIGRTTLELKFWQKDEDRRSYLQELSLNGLFLDRDIWLVRKDGVAVYGMCSQTTLHAFGQQCILTLIVDITKRKEVEEALQASEARYRAIVEDQTELVYRYRPDGRLSFVNAAYERHCGKDELLDTRFEPDIPAEDHDLIARLLAARTPEHPLADFEHRVRMPDGRLCWQRWTHRAIYSPCGELLETQAVGRDITERRQAEEARLAAESKYRTIFENAPVGIFRSTPDGRYIEANPQTAAILGYATPGELLSEVRDIALQVYEKPEDRSKLYGLLNHSDLVEQFEMRVKRKDGSLLWVAVTCRAVRDAQGKIAHCDGFLVDISERKKLEQLREDVERIMRHDLKSPIIGLMGLPYLMGKEAPLTQKQTEYLGHIERIGNKLLKQIDMSLCIYKMELGAYKCLKEVVDVLAVLRNVVSEAQRHMQSRRHELIFTIDGNAVEFKDVCLTIGEDFLYSNMLDNLFRNAVEAAPKGGTITLEMLTSDLPRQQNNVPYARLLHIRNTGEVPVEIRETFFEKYVTHGKRHGTGLGTYSARLIAQTMGADLHLDTSVPGYTTVTVAFPALG